MFKYFLNISILFLLFSCSHTVNTGAIQRAEISYIKFIGNFEDVTVVLDSANPIDLSNEKDNTLFRTDKGKHSLKIYRGDNLIVNRIIFIEDHATFEVLVP